MQRLTGIAVSPGVAIGETLVLDSEGFQISRRFVARDAVPHELERLAKAITAAALEIDRNREAVGLQLGDQYAAVFSAHHQMLCDPRLRTELESAITDRQQSPEYAVSCVLGRYAEVFRNLESGYFSERAHDIHDIEKRLLNHLLGERREELAHLSSPVLVLAHTLTPSETAGLDRNWVRGFATETGGPGSHTAIMAEALGIPAVVGLGPFLDSVSSGVTIIIDGNEGIVLLQPDEETLARYRQEVEDHRSLAAKLECLRDLPAETADGVRVQLLGNIEFPYEVESCQQRGADGIGLYRTEFLYLGAEVEPTEDEHYEAYASVLRAMPGQPVVIRTLDLGADKVPTLPSPEDERNPFLGMRSIRLSLRNLPLFRTQLRAILRASLLGDVQVMFPMITTLLELRQAKMVLADVMEDLEENGIPFNRDLPVGIMVEVPAAVVMLDRFIEELSFISIGTNDLIQYTLAVDRSNREVADLYTASDPAVLRLIARAIETADTHEIPVSVCGQMSGNSTYTMLLLGLGLRRFSVTPGAIPEIKKICRSVTIPQCQALAEHVMTLENARDIKSYLKKELKAVVPELFV